MPSASSVWAATPWPSWTMPSSRCSVPMALWFRRRASSWANTTTRRARSVNFSNTTLPLVAGARLRLCGTVCKAAVPARLRLGTDRLESFAQDVGNCGRIVRPRLHADVGDRTDARRSPLDRCRVAHVERRGAEARRLDGDVDGVVEAGRALPFENGLHEHHVEIAEERLLGLE